MPVFTIGERVALNGLLAELQGALGRVISVAEHHGGIYALDEYEVVFDDATKLRLCRFQLTHTKQGQKTQEDERTFRLLDGWGRRDENPIPRN